MYENFKGGFFKSETGEVIEVRFINGVLNLRFMNDNEFFELITHIDGWFYGISRYAVQILDNEIILIKGDDLNKNRKRYPRIEKEN